MNNFRAQNDAHFRKEKMQSLKQCDRNQKFTKGMKTPTQCQRDDERASQIDKLLKEIDVLKDANKTLADKVQV